MLWNALHLLSLIEKNCSSCDGTGNYYGRSSSIGYLPCEPCGGSGKKKKYCIDEERVVEFS